VYEAPIVVAVHYFFQGETMTDNIVPQGFDFSDAKVEGGLWSLNYFWELAGSDENQRPAQWARLPETEKLIERLK
jgi:hypothetical protein